MFDNEESMAETSEMLVQNCYSRLKHAGIVSCKEKFTDIETELKGVVDKILEAVAKFRGHF